MVELRLRFFGVPSLQALQLFVEMSFGCFYVLPHLHLLHIYQLLIVLNQDITMLIFLLTCIPIMILITRISLISQEFLNDFVPKLCFFQSISIIVSTLYLMAATSL